MEAFSACLYIIPHNITSLLLAAVLGVCDGTRLLIQLLDGIAAYAALLLVVKHFSV